jgi:hypothetical protein
MNETIAVYIDGDNTSHKDMKDILYEINSYGRIIISRVYGDWSQIDMKKWLKTTSTYGIIPIQCERINGKNSSDIKLCVDLMKDLYSIENISLFYIITTDSDYRHVISEIKVMNKKIHCIGNDFANISLMSICDKYTKISVLRKYDTDVKVLKNIDNDNKQKITELYINDIETILGDNKQINISLINDILSRKYNFDFREWGYNKMSVFIKDNFSEYFSLKQIQNGIYISNK